MWSDDILGFETEEFAFLSNMYKFDEPICIGGYPFISSEHYYQSMKSKNKLVWLAMQNLEPKETKTYWRNRKNNIRSDWKEIKLLVMYDALTAKFSIPELRQKLLDTGDRYLEETNWWKDTYWGVCDGVGENHLGKMLMYIREKIKHVQN